MLKKPVVWFVLMAYMAFMVLPAIAGEDKSRLSEEQALAIVKKKIDFAVEEELLRTEYYEDDLTGDRNWRFYWTVRKNDVDWKIDVGVDADSGDIIFYWADEDIWPGRKKRLPKPMTWTAALPIARSMAEKMQPQRIKQARVSEEVVSDYEQFGRKLHTFRFTQYVNGIPFPENVIFVLINAHNGEVYSYGFHWKENISFTKPDTTISKEQAEKIFRSRIRLNQNYISMLSPYMTEFNRKEVPLYYTLGEWGYENVFVDTIRGTVVDADGKEVVFGQVFSSPVNGNGSDNIEENRAVSFADANRLAREMAYIPQDYVLAENVFYEGWAPDSLKTYGLKFKHDNNRDGPTYFVGIDALTGDLRDYNKSHEETGEENNNHVVNYDWQRCRQIALEYIKKVTRRKLPDIQVSVQEPNGYILNGKKWTPPTYSFDFKRMVQGIPFNSNSISVEVDNRTGEVVNYWTQWETLKFTPPDRVITEEEALNRLMKGSSPRLIYMVKGTVGRTTGGEAGLYYAFFGSEPKVVNAVTGQVLNTRETADWYNPPDPYTDISEHWAAAEIKFLAAAGVVSGGGGNFRPGQPVSRAEFLTMIVKAKGLAVTKPARVSYTDISQNDWYAGAAEAATKAGWLRGDNGKFYPQRSVTRQEMAVIVAKALDTPLPDYPNYFALNFTDNAEIAPWAQGAIKVSVDLGLLAGRNDIFAPRDSANRAEAAFYIFKVMNVHYRTFEGDSKKQPFYSEWY